MEKDQLLSINRPQKLCMNCNAPLEPIERHPSVLRSRNKREFERLDYCPECWQQMKDEAYESFWITKRVIKLRERKLTRKERNAALRALFESLWDRREDEDVGPHLYFLAHLMMKWGSLKWKKSATDPQGRESIVFENPVSGEFLEVTAYEVDDERMQAIHTEIEQFLRQYAADDQITL
jgi:hypothetical protein